MAMDKDLIPEHTSLRLGKSLQLQLNAYVTSVFADAGLTMPSASTLLRDLIEVGLDVKLRQLPKPQQRRIALAAEKKVRK